METFTPYLNQIPDPEHREILKNVLFWAVQNFPELQPKIAWNQPMFTAHNTFIIGFSAAKHHFSVAPEREAMERLSDEITESGYQHTKQLVRIPWTDPVNFELLKKIIQFNISDKADCLTFWRKPSTASLK